MGDGPDLEDRSSGTHLAGNDFGDRAIHIAVWERTFLNKRGNSLCVSRAAIDVDQSRLNHGVTRRGDCVVAAGDDVRFKNVIIAQNILRVTDGNE